MPGLLKEFGYKCRNCNRRSEFIKTWISSRRGRLILFICHTCDNIYVTDEFGKLINGEDF